MQNFVKDRGASPQNGQPAINFARQAIAANAKVSIKDRPSSRNSLTRPNIPSRGLGNAQNSSAILQQRPEPREQKHDLYDTDAGSIDTTVNLSVHQSEGAQANSHQHEQHDQVIDSGEESNQSDDLYEVEYEDDLGQGAIKVLTANQFQIYQREEQLRHFNGVSHQSLPTIDGDSYPTTTDGQPTVWEGGEEQHFEVEARNRAASPSPQRMMVAGKLTRSSAPQPLHNGAVSNRKGASHISPKPHSIFQQSAGLRGQQRAIAQPVQQSASNFQSHMPAQFSSQPPTYSQANPGNRQGLPQHHDVRQNSQEQAPRPPQHEQQHRSGLSQAQFQALPLGMTSRPAERHSSTRLKAEPTTKQPPVGPAPVMNVSVAPGGDYEHEKLFAMNYEDLKMENFDVDPYADPPVLVDDILQKPLIERLEFVQKELETEQQTKFFCSLPTTEWEDAGDWFLDRFQSIIQRTKEARQKKRKLAQGFELEVEKRHKHVAKKQHQVEDAMDKMKTQGEGLMPKSPRPRQS